MINKHNTISTRSMKEYSESSFTEILLSIDWSVVLNCIDVNEAWEKFKVLFTLAMDSIAPMIEKRINIRTEPWVNDEILELIQERERALRISNQNKANTELQSELSH